MTTDKSKRKLVAIVHADVKGYSRMMGEDDEYTVRTLASSRQEMFRLVELHEGQVRDTAGDGFLLEFPSVADAVKFAVEFQREMKKRNADIPPAKRMEFRIGVNIGDVIHEGGTIYGEGVNIAARLESLADSGGICISGAAYEQVRKRLDVGFEYVGERSVKNIEEPVRTYKVLLEDSKPPPTKLIRGELAASTVERRSFDESLQGWIGSSLDLCRENRLTELVRSTERGLTEFYWVAAYRIEGEGRLKDLMSLKRTLLQIQRDEPDGPYWWIDESGDRPGPRPSDNNHALVYWRDLMSDWSGREYTFELWRASMNGMMFYLQGHSEDVRPSDVGPGLRLRETTPIREAAICLSHAVRLAKAMGDPNAIIHFTMVWEGLKGRELNFLYPLYQSTGPPVCFEGAIHTDVFSVRLHDVETTFPEIVSAVTEPLFTAFSLYKTTQATVDKVIQDLKRRVPNLWDI